MTAQAFALN